MRNLKRALSLALASVMLLGMMVVGASATSYTDVAADDNLEAIEVAEALGLMEGKGNNKFDPDGTVTREELAGIVTKLMGYDPDDYTGVSHFTDVDPNAWYAPFIEAVYSNGIMAGIGDGKFGLGTKVAYYEIGTAICKALGYFQVSGDYGDDYVAAGVKQATKAGLDEGLDNTNPRATLTRNQIAQICLNALQAEMVEADENTGIKVEGDGFSVTVGGAKYSPKTSTNSKYSKIDDEHTAGSAVSTSNPYTVQLGEEIYGGKLEKKTGANYDTDDFGRAGYSWVYDKETVGTYSEEADYVVVLSKDYSGTVLAALQDATDNDKLSFASQTLAATASFLNGTGKAIDSDDNSDIKNALKRGTTVEVTVDDNDVITRLVVYNYSLNKITGINTDVSSKDAKDGVSCYVTFEKGGLSKVKNTDIKGFNAATYVEDAYVAVIAKGTTEVIASYIPKTVEGSVETVKGTDYLTIGGTKYYPGAGFASGASAYMALNNVSVKASESYKLYLDEGNNILGIEGVKTAAQLDEVYFVVNVWEGDPTNDRGESYTPTYAQLVSVTDGVLSEVELEMADKNDKSSASSKTLENRDKYTDGYEGTLVTITDEAWDATTQDSKDIKCEADDERFDLIPWNHDANEDFDIYTELTLDGKELKTDSTRLTVNSKKNDAGAADATFRFDSATKYIFVEGTTNKVKTYTYTGGVDYAFSESGNLGTDKKSIAITEANETKVQYMVIVCKDADQKTEFNSDLVYVKAASGEKGDGYYLQDVYLADGTKETWKVSDKSGKYASAAGFYAYTQGEKYYELSNSSSEVPTLTITVDGGLYVWEDEEGVLIDATMAKGALVDDLLTVTTGGHKYEDIKVSGAVFVDLHQTDTTKLENTYDSNISSLERLVDLLDNDTVKSCKVSMNVDKDGAIIIFLTEAKTAT